MLLHIAKLLFSCQWTYSNRSVLITMKLKEIRCCIILQFLHQLVITIKFIPNSNVPTFRSPKSRLFLTILLQIFSFSILDLPQSNSCPLDILHRYDIIILMIYFFSFSFIPSEQCCHNSSPRAFHNYITALDNPCFIRCNRQCNAGLVTQHLFTTYKNDKGF